jgi:hypothetical protein
MSSMSAFSPICTSGCLAVSGASSSQSLRISTSKQAARLAPAQKKFNTLIGRINRQRKRLAEWQKIMPIYQEEVLNTFQPLRDSYAGFQAQMVELLDSHWVYNRFSRLQKEKVSHIIRDICVELINAHGRDDLKPIANRHSDIDFDDQQEQMKAMGGDVLRDMLEAEFALILAMLSWTWMTRMALRRNWEAFLKNSSAKRKSSTPKHKKSARQLAREQREKKKRTKSASRFGRSTGNWLAHYIRTGKQIPRSNSAKPI